MACSRQAQGQLLLQTAAGWAAAGRLDRIAAVGGQKARATILPPVGEGAPRLLLSGTESTVQAMKDELAQILGDGGRSVPIHAHDAAKLKKPARKLGQFEEGSGCRMVLEDEQKKRLDDPITTPRHHRVRLFGDKNAQAKALGLLASHLEHSDSPLKESTLVCDYQQACDDWLSWKNMQEGNTKPMEVFFKRMPDMVPHAQMEGNYPVHLKRVEASADGPGCFFSFDTSLCGAGLEMPHAQVSNSVVRQRLSAPGGGNAPLQDLVVVGKGYILPFVAG